MRRGILQIVDGTGLFTYILGEILSGLHVWIIYLHQVKNGQYSPNNPCMVCLPVDIYDEINQM